MGATGTNVFLYEITIFHGYQWVPMGTKSQGVMGTTGINAFNFHSEYVCVFICGTVRIQPGGRSTTDPMFIRVSPLFVYLNPQYFHIRHI